MTKTKSREVDYYAILNVSKKATPEEIRGAYKKLAVTYHPDRQNTNANSNEDVTPQLLQEAKEKFTLIKSAYDALIDEQKRAIYDLYGIEGLEAGTQLSRKYKSTEELKREFEKLQRRKEEAEQEKRVQSKGTVAMAISASHLYDVLTQSRNLPEVSSMSISQAVTAPFSEKNVATLSGTVATNNGNGTNSLALGLHRTLSANANGFLQLTTSTGATGFQLGTWRRLSKYSTGSITGLLQTNGESNFTVSFQRQLGKQTRGTYSWSAGLNSNMKLAIEKGFDKNVIAGEIVAEADDIEVGASATSVVSKKTTLKTSIGVSLFNHTVSFNVGGSRALSKISRFGMYVIISTESITLQLSFSRGNQRFLFPILLTNEITLKAVAASLIGPTLFCGLAKVFWIEPRRKLKKRRKIEELRKENAEIIAEARRGAEAAVKLMLTTVARKREQEEAKKGLIIIYAVYGNLEEMNNPKPNKEKEAEQKQPSFIEVTIPLQYLVEDSQLHLHESVKSNLLGFYDPCIGEEKQLYIRYLFHDKIHEVTIDDTETLGIPLASHRIDEVTQ